MRRSGIWPSELVVDSVALGDAWRHPAIRTQDRSDRIVPFHKLSQWLTCSLIEPIEQAGVTVTDLDGLTGLPEYRNGGLLIDTGVIVPRAPLDPTAAHDVASELIVEWRALTVALLDRLREPVRRHWGSPRSRCRNCCRAAPGSPAAASRRGCARPMARRRSPSRRTGRSFEGVDAAPFTWRTITISLMNHLSCDPD